MKKIYLIALLLVGGTAFSQSNPEIQSELPQVIPPSPTVAALMRFEEMPVSHYTGIPDVSVPLYSTATHSKDISINIALKYHPSGIRTEEVAGYNGQGWALSGAGGTISRTVKGLPDEYLSYGTADGTGPRVGIYNIFAATYPNRYYQILPLLDVVAVPGDNTLSKFFWEAHEKGIYDTEHDLYQYNFQNYSGRFFLKKDGGSAIVVPLDNNPVKIVYNEGSGFTIYDDKGYRYLFLDKEVTTTTTNVNNTLYSGASSSIGSPMTYTSAYQLSTVYDTNEMPLVSYTYEDFNENQRMVNVVRMDLSMGDASYVQQFIANYGPCPPLENSIEPRLSTQVTYNNIVTKKIKKITINDKAVIEFGNAVGRSDSNINNPATAPKLSSVTLKDWYGTTIKTTDFEYTTEKRMRLKKVIVGSPLTTQKETTEFFYAMLSSNGKDFWGYPNKIQNTFCSVGTEAAREVTKATVMDGVLQKISYPTGGCVIFDYESNTYSHVGNERLQDFSGNPDNQGSVDLPGIGLTSAPGQNTANLGYFATSAVYGFDSAVTAGGVVHLLKKNASGTVIESRNLAGLNCGRKITLEAGYYYSLLFGWFDINSSGGATIAVKSYFNTDPPIEWLYGGGIRIKKIAYFTATVPQDYYSLSITQQLPHKANMAKEKFYSYQYPNLLNSSSGSLVSAKPDFKYTITKNHGERVCGIFDPRNIQVQAFRYEVSTNFNNLSFVKTQGAEVGYQYVTVSETGNGKTVYSFTSPIDFPEEATAYSTEYPFLPSPNVDYKRGLPLSEQVYKNGVLGQLLSESLYTYAYEDKRELSGIKLFSNNNCGFSKHYASYEGYQNMLDTCPGGTTTGMCGYYCGPVTNFVLYYKVWEAFGWPKLVQKKTRNYATGSPVETTESFSYNPVNRRIASHTTSNSTGENLKTDYFYDPGNSSNRISEISLIEQFRNTELLSVSKLNYSGSYPLNSAILPFYVQASKGTEALENRLWYNNYDEFSNPLEVFQEQGMQTSYIWGYNKTQVIAKIENIGYANINAGLITAAQNASNTAGATGLEAALTSLRNSLPTAMVTTYTYKPMVGVSTVTDPKGDKVSYIYDAFGRLSSVKDKNGYILSLNNYNYRTQN